VSSITTSREIAAHSGFKVRGLRWWIIGLIFLATVINYIDRQTINVLAPVLLSDLHLGKRDFANVTSAFLLCYMVGMGVWGRLVDKIGTRTAFAIAITIWSVAACLHSLVAGFVSLLLLRSVLALGEAGNWPGAAKGVAEWFPVRERALGMAIFNSGAAVGAIVATPILVFMQLHYGWKQTFLVTGGLGFAWLVAWLQFFRTPDRHPWLTEEEKKVITANEAGAENQKTTARGALPIRELLRYRQVWAIIAARLCTDPVWWLYITWLPQYLADARGFNLKQIGVFAWIPYCGSGIGALLGGYTSGRLIKSGVSLNRARKICMIIGAALMPAGVLAARVQSPMLAIVLIAIVLFAFQFWMNNVQALPGDFFPQSTVGAVFGLGGVAAGAGSFAFMMASGWIVEKFSYGPMFLIAGVLGPLGAVALFVLAGPIQRVAPLQAR
jgi:MFS transporter, ACS family, hexuronate transporter